MSGYTLTFDPQTAVMEAKVEGFFDDAEMERFATEFATMRDDLRRRGVRFGILGDGTLFAVQSQAVAQVLTRLVNAADQNNRSPVALVAGSALVRMQVGRSMAAAHVRVFDDRQTALAWLDEKKTATA